MVNPSAGFLCRSKRKQEEVRTGEFGLVSQDGDIEVGNITGTERTESNDRNHSRTLDLDEGFLC